MMNFSRIIRLSLAILSGMAGPAMAGSQTGTVTAVSIDTNGGPYVFMLSGTHGAQPGCASDGYWAITSISTDNAKSMIATILTAYASGKQVYVEGAGTCPPSYPRESVAFVIAQ